MLCITIKGADLWDEEQETFVPVKDQTLKLEHSLVSISKWESKWHKAFLTKREKTAEETLGYIECMTITQNVDPNVYKCLTNADIKKINEYIQNPMTATYISEDKNGRRNNEQITSELIYYWMVTLNIPFECEKWHINRLLMLIKICNIKNQPPKKMTPNQIRSRNAALNAARRKQFNTRG